MSENLEVVKQIIQRVAGVRSVAPDTRLYHDLGLTGDDAYEALEEIAKRFCVSFVECRFDRFFPEECEAIEAHFLRDLGLRSKLVPVTVQHLAVVVDRKAWFDPAGTSD